MAKNKVFFHGIGNGIGEMMRTVDAAGIPFVIKSIKNEGFVVEGVELARASGLPHTIVYRDPAPDGLPNDIPNLDVEPAVSAAAFWERVKNVLPAGVKDNRDLVWVEPTNEMSTNNTDHPGAAWVGQWCLAMAILMNEDGYRAMLWGANGGQPGQLGEPADADWYNGFSPFLEYAGNNREIVAISLHEGILKVDYRTDPAWHPLNHPWIAGRYEFAINAADVQGFPRPTILLSEWAESNDDIPGFYKMVADIDWLSADIARYENVLGACLWDLDSIGTLTNFIPWITAYTLNTEHPDPQPPPSRIEVITDQLTVHDEEVYAKRDMATVDTLVVHHTVSDPMGDPDNIAKFHVGVRNWPGIGYHFLISGEGRIYQTNDLDTISNHAKGANDRAIGIGLQGDFSHVHPPEAQQEAAAWLIDYLYYGGTEAPIEAVAPHRLVSVTACPGDTWHEWWGNIAPEPEPPNGNKEEFMWRVSVETQAISLNPAAGLQQAIAADSFQIVGDEQHVSFDGVQYVIQAAERLDGTQPRRVYEVPLPASGQPWESPTWFTDPAAVPDPPVENPAIDMANYFMPGGGPEFGPWYGHIYIITNNWGDPAERVQLQGELGGISYVVKNSQWEKRVVGNDYIDLVMDTSPGDGKYYTSSGHWIPRIWGVGWAAFPQGGTVRFYRKDNCELLTENPAVGKLECVDHLDTWTSPAGITVNDVVVLEWIVNGALEETYYFAAGLGLVRWKRTNSDESWISELIPRGSQEDNVREVIECL